MKRQGQRQPRLEEYFGKRVRVEAYTEEEKDNTIVVATGKSALEMIAEAYDNVEEEQEQEEEQVGQAGPVQESAENDESLQAVKNDYFYDAIAAMFDEVDQDAGYNRPTRPAEQTGGAYGFSSSDEEPEPVENAAVEADASETTEASEAEIDEDAPNGDLALEDLFEVVDHRQKRVRKFGFNGYQTKFVLKDNERIEHPVEVLRHVLQRFIDEALENSREHGHSTDWLGISFITDTMKKGNGGKGEWLIPFRPPEENNADKILQEMEKFDQSENSPELFNTVITMIVTTIKRPEGGAADRRTRKAQVRRKKERDPAIVKITNTDNLCLFRALRVAIHYYELGGGEWKYAQKYATANRLKHDAIALRNASGVPEKKGMYSGKDAETVHQYLERTDPGKYRILIFTPESKTETVYNSGNNAHYNLCLYNHNGHYEVIKTPQKFFGSKNYCVDCEKTYANIADHKECSIRCPQCFRSGPGFPCQGEPGKELECLDCRKLFRNQDCIDNHKPYSCNEFHRCPLCNCHYHVEPNRKNGGHDCNEKFCRICFQKHRKDKGCYISPLKEKKVEAHRIIAYDVETIIRRTKAEGDAEGNEDNDSTVAVAGNAESGRFSETTDGEMESSDMGEEEDEEEEQSVRRRRRNPFVDMEADEDSDEEDAEVSRPHEKEEDDEHFGRPYDPKKTDHECNYISAIVTCSDCIDKGTWKDLENKDCEVCGPQKVFKMGEWEVEEGKDLVDEFLDFLLYDLPSGHKTYAYAHNGGRYDGYFMMRKLYGRPKLRPTMTSTGHKMFQIRVRGSKHHNEVFLRDSCMMFPMKLEEAPAAFDLPVQAKMYFPYLYNIRANYQNPIEGLPPLEDYIMDKFKTHELAAFKEWHEQEDKKRREEGTLFVLEDALEEYCYNDVEILIHAIVRFREIFNEQAGSDLFNECVTIASGCVKIWRKKYLKKNRVGIVTNNGYGRFDRQSAMALKYLKWFAWAHRIDVQHCDSEQGEKKVVHYKLDGYVKPKAWDSTGFKQCNLENCPYCENRPEGNVALEYNGCVYHGCPFKCFKNDTKLPTGKRSSEQLDITNNRIDFIESRGYTVIPVRECQVKEELKRNKEMKHFFDYCIDTGHINPRDGFYGGRVGPMRMHYEPGPDEEIKFFDIVSQYPHVLRNAFPVGHPKVIREFEDTEWDDDSWSCVYSKEYKGVFKVWVLPPKDLTIPVLPFRDNNRLLFPLCQACSIDSRKASPFREPSCGHSDLERAFVTTTTHVELDLAFKAGYKVLRVIEVLHYEEWDDTIFEDYIVDFMRLKEEATGWEEIGKIKDPVERNRAMDAFIEDYFENTKKDGKPGVRLRKDCVKENAALRQVVKLFLNCLWGRLAMRANKTHTELIRSPAALYKLLDSTSKIVESIIYLNADTMRVSWKHVDRFEQEDESGNVVYAMFTTSYGRAELYKHMCAVEESAGGAKGAKFLYGDTDSIIYVRKKGTEPIKNGRYLGDMKDEMPKHEILEFICGGNKQYALKLKHRETSEITTKQKIRGITLNSATSELLRYEKMREMILSPTRSTEEQIVTLKYDVIRRDNWYNVFTLSMEKIYRPIFMKGWISNADERLRIWPYGFVKSEDRDKQPDTQLFPADYYLKL